DKSEKRMFHMAVLRVAGDVKKIKFQGLPVRRRPGRHTRPVAGVTIMRQDQAVIIQIKHGNRMVILGGIVFSRLAHLMYKGVTAGGYAQGDIPYDSIAHFFYWRVS